MQYRIQTYHPESNLFTNTNHGSDDLELLIRKMNSPIFAGFNVQIVDSDFNVVVAPKEQRKAGEHSVADIAAMLDVPMLGSATEAFDLLGIENYDDDDE